MRKPSMGILLRATWRTSYYKVSLAYVVFCCSLCVSGYVSTSPRNVPPCAATILTSYDDSFAEHNGYAGSKNVPTMPADIEASDVFAIFLWDLLDNKQS